MFQIKGPLGPGIGLSKRGEHVAYTAGTGILVFLDLVAYLVIRIVDKYGGLGIGNVDDKNLSFPH